NLALADLLCHFIGVWYEGGVLMTWLPQIFIANGLKNIPEFFIKLSSKRFFDKVKPVFDVENAEEFLQFLNEFENQLNGRSRLKIYAFNDLPFLTDLIKRDEVAVNR
ncbi:MAG: hypothetical protein WBA74_16395, partial [Cyclobacteriaceae bacterium]